MKDSVVTEWGPSTIGVYGPNLPGGEAVGETKAKERALTRGAAKAVSPPAGAVQAFGRNIS